MCGRLRLPSDYSQIKIQLRFGERWPAPNLQASWNVAPTQQVLVARHDAATGERRPDLMRWGIIPPWEKEPKTRLATHNAVSEELEKKALYKGLWAQGRRCLVVSDGFYEWKPGPTPKDKQPYAVARADGKLTVFAGLWDERSWGPETIRSATIITCASHIEFAPIHDRFPVILDEEMWPAWLGEVSAAPDELRAMLIAPAMERLRVWPVSTAVSNSRNDGPDLIEPITLRPPSLAL
jgi:putative SOS response-associated peptidase YedK